MRINRMNATFGKLDQATLELQPGLNILYAPNESGKSTWSQFIRIMLYGLSTRERGPMATKNRFAPWNGNAMRGRMDVEADGQRYTILRDTARATAPMGEFRCTYTDTANEVPGITSQIVGEVLLGVGSEVFSRSAFIGQSGLTVDQDAELERRILSLLTSGEEEISYSQTRDALKKQLNRRKANKSTGLIPALERECLQLEEALAQLQSLHQQEDAARLLLQQRQQQEAEVRLRIGQWEDLQKQEALRCCLRAQQEAQQADARAAELEKTPIPDAAYLARLEGMAQALDHTLDAAKEAEENARKLRQEAEAAGKVWRDHPLYPADEATLQQRLQEPAAAGTASPGDLWRQVCWQVQPPGLAYGCSFPSSFRLWESGLPQRQWYSLFIMVCFAAPAARPLPRLRSNGNSWPGRRRHISSCCSVPAPAGTRQSRPVPRRRAPSAAAGKACCSF